MFIRTDANFEDEADLTKPQEVAEAFTAIAEMMIEAFGPSEARALLEAIIERDGGELN
ncbi:MAG TPA: hypothetical protein VGN79_01820 [Devosia sp.]|jgi:hypothetical protein|nr:hypothetical protein [Devosia sp.]